MASVELIVLLGVGDGTWSGGKVERRLLGLDADAAELLKEGDLGEERTAEEKEEDVTRKGRWRVGVKGEEGSMRGSWLEVRVFGRETLPVGSFLFACDKGIFR
jgi:hypothetical protein